MIKMKYISQTKYVQEAKAKKYKNSVLSFVLVFWYVNKKIVFSKTP